MRAAGIHRDITCNGTRQLRRGIGRVKETLMRYFTRNREIGNARLHAHRAVSEIDIKDAVHFADADNDRIFLRNSATGE